MTALLLLATLLGQAGSPAAPGPVPPGRLRVAIVAPELSPSQRTALTAAAQQGLERQTSFRAEVVSAPEDCRGDECALQLARGEGAQLGLVLFAGVPNLVLELRGSFADGGTGKVLRRTVKGGNPDAPAEAVSVVLGALLPKWAGQGFASLTVDAPADAVVKVDGRRVGVAPLQEVVAVAAGVHEVDVVLPSGEALLYRRRLEEGARFHLDADLAAAAAAVAGGRGGERAGWVRPSAYALWSVGAVAVAASLVAGGLSRGAGRDLGGCGEQDRTCLRIDEARASQERAEGYARTGNVLLVGGAALGAAGAGLFVFDVVSE